MSTEINRVQAHQKWKGKSPGIVEFTALLNNFPYAAILIEPRTDTILVANAEYFRLSAFSQTDVDKLHVSDIFPSLSRYYLFQPTEHQTLMLRHTHEKIEVVVRGFGLDPHANCILVQITPYEKHNQLINESAKQQFVSGFMDLVSRQISANDLTSSIDGILKTSNSLLSSKIQCVYQVDNSLQKFSKVSTTEQDIPVFPPHTPYFEVTESKTDVWVPGKRVTNEIHRIGRIADLSYVSIYPLEQNDTKLGLYILADTGNPPDENLIQLGEVIASGLESILYHYAVVENLGNGILQQKRVLNIRDTAINNTDEGIILIRKDLTISEMNPSAEFMLGYAAREVIGVPVENIIIGADSMVPALKEILEGLPTHNLGNVMLHRRNGDSFLVHLITYPVYHENELQGILLFIRDESENEQIRIKSQQLEQRALLGELMAIMAHEVRNPVNNISTGLNYLGMNLQEDEKSQDIMRRIQEDCGRLTHLVDSILMFSKTMGYNLIPIDLSSVLHRLLDRYRPRLTNINVQTYLQVEPDIRKVIGDSRALEQVFVNLFNNALAVMPKGGVLAIKMANQNIQTDQPQVEITVSDTGPGIPDEIKDHIFEPFVTNNPQGTGLGLAITKRIITAHKGNISVTSFPGGTVFHVTLPAEKTDGVN